MTSKEVKNKIYNEFNKGVSLKTIDWIFSEFRYTLKRIHYVPERRNDDRAILERNVYAGMIFPLLTENNGKTYFLLMKYGTAL
jgi:hypothetical protein